MSRTFTVKRLSRCVGAIVLLVVAMLAVPQRAAAHTTSPPQKTANGCLIALHGTKYGALDWLSAETCATRDNYYRARLRDNHATSDGSCVFAEFSDDLSSPGVVMAASCTSTGTSFTFLDPQRNLRSHTWLCRTRDGMCIGTWNTNY